MLPDWRWKQIWNATEARDFEFSVCCAVLEKLTRLGEFSEREAISAASDLGYSIGVATAAVERLKWNRAIVYTNFDPNGGSTFKITGRPARRTPLGGKIFRGPTKPTDRRLRENRRAPLAPAPRPAVYSWPSDLSMDAIRARLSPPAAEVATLFANGHTKDEVSNILQISNRQTKKIMHEIRSQLELA